MPKMWCAHATIMSEDKYPGYHRRTFECNARGFRLEDDATNKYAVLRPLNSDFANHQNRPVGPYALRLARCPGTE